MRYLEAEYANQKKSGFPKALKGFLTDRLKVSLGASVVDVGGGTGDYLSEWGPAVCKTVVDRENGLRLPYRTSIGFAEWDFEKDWLPVKADLILCKSVIEHQPDPVKFVKLIAGSLNSRGFLVLIAPDFETCYLDFYDDPTHVSPTTLRGLEQAVKMAGLKIMESGKFGQTPFLIRHRVVGAAIRALMPKKPALGLYRLWGIDWPRRASQAACYVIARRA